MADKEYLKNLYKDEYKRDEYPTSTSWGLSEENNVGVDKELLQNEELYKVPTEGTIYNAKDYNVTLTGDNNAGNLTILLNSLVDVEGVKIIKFEKGTYYMSSTILANNLNNVYLVGEEGTKFVYTPFTLIRELLGEEKLVEGVMIAPLEFFFT